MHADKSSASAGRDRGIESRRSAATEVGQRAFEFSSSRSANDPYVHIRFGFVREVLGVLANE